MSQSRQLLLASLGLALSISILAPAVASAQSEETQYTRGVGFKGANVFEPKYKERIGTYEEQIQMGETKGWLTADEVTQFRARLEDMKKEEAAAAAKNWVKEDVDRIDKLFTKFNMDFAAAGNKPKASTNAADANPAPDLAKPASPVAGGETKTTTKTTTTEAKAPAKKAKAAPKKKGK